MEKLLVQYSQLKDGAVEVHGYKHAMVQVIAASIALNIPVMIRNAPLVDDSFVLKKIIERSGGACSIDGHCLAVDPRGMTDFHIEDTLSKKIHGSLYLIPAFALRFGKFLCGETGGCQIGSSELGGKRPIDHVLDVMHRFGITASFPENGGIQGQRISYPPQVSLDILDYSESRDLSISPKISGATKTALLCAIRASHTKIYHPYSKTDVRDLLRFLWQCGYQISLSKELIEIKAPLTTRKNEWVEFDLTECVSEIMTYIALAVHVGIRLRIKVKNMEFIKLGLIHEFDLLRKMKVNFQLKKEEIFIERAPFIRGIDIEVTNDTIQSDHHPFFALMLLRGDQKSKIREFVWRDRFAYVFGLQKLGGALHQEGNMLHITPSRLTTGGHTLHATDTRAAAVLLIGALTAESSVNIENIQHLHRGYENLIAPLQSLGANLFIMP